MSNSEQSICTLHIKLANIDAIADLLYQLDGTGDITALDCHTLMNTAATIQKLSNECEEAVSELESICHKHNKEVISDDFKEVDGVWTYKGFPVSEVEKLDQESVELALQYQGFSEENKIRASQELDRVELEYGKGITDSVQEIPEVTDESNVGNSDDFYDYIRTEANKIGSAFDALWRKAREIEKLENHSEDYSIESDQLKNLVLLMSNGFDEVIENIIGVQRKFQRDDGKEAEVVQS